MVEYSYENDKLVISGSPVKLPTDIGDVLQIDETIIVLFKSLGRDTKVGNGNIWAFDNNGSKLWEVEEEPPQGSDSENPFVYVWEENGELWAQCWGNHEHRVDLKTGELIEKRPYR